MRRLAFILLVLIFAVSPAYGQTVFWFSGGEIGDTNEMTNVSATFVATNTCSLATTANCSTAGAAHTGDRCFCVNVGSSQGRSAAGIGNTTAFVRIYFWLVAVPAANQALFSFANSGGTHFINIGLDTTPKLIWQFDNITTPTATGTTTLSTGQWYRIDVKGVVAASGGAEVKLNNSVEFTSLATNTSSMTSIDHVRFGPGFSQNVSFRYDDLMICTGAYCPNGGTIARQGAAGTPTYNAWTKNSCTGGTIDGCWSNTPFSTGSNASSTVASDAQTMFVSTFSATQSGHGTETIKPHDTINACKTAGIMKSGTASAPISIRRRINGSDTDTSKTLTTSDAYYDDGIWTVSADTLRGSTMEIGAVHGAGGATDTVEDMWMLCDYLAGPTSVNSKTTQE